MNNRSINDLALFYRIFISSWWIIFSQFYIFDSPLSRSKYVFNGCLWFTWKSQGKLENMFPGCKFNTQILWRYLSRKSYLYWKKLVHFLLCIIQNVTYQNGTQKTLYIKYIFIFEKQWCVCCYYIFNHSNISLSSDYVFGKKKTFSKIFLKRRTSKKIKWICIL